VGRGRCLAPLLLWLACGQNDPPTGRAADPDAAAETAPDAALPRPDTGSDRTAPPADLASVNTADAATPAADTAPPAPGDAAPPDGAAGPATVLLFHRATGYVHESKGAAALAIQRGLAAFDVMGIISEDPVAVTVAKLASYRAVVLIDTTGKPFGDPGSDIIDELVAWVRAGGGLVGIHAASNGHETNPAYVGLIGGDFTEHPGGVRMGRCQPEGMHPSVVRLPAMFTLTDEFYQFQNFRPDNIVDLRCDALTGNQKLPIAWHRDEGAGRVFFTALGHSADEWNDRRIVADHVIPGILWTIRR
jgi:uncharacterized protein